MTGEYPTTIRIYRSKCCPLDWSEYGSVGGDVIGIFPTPFDLFGGSEGPLRPFDRGDVVEGGWELMLR